MLDAVLIQKCADPSLKPALVEQFVEAAGASDPLTVTVKSGNRVVLVPKPRSTDEALAIIRDNVGRAVVRVGLTQLPAGVGVKDASELPAGLVDPCENLRIGTRMFAKILRIVARWYGDPKGDEARPQILEDAIYAWKTGEFEGENVFRAEDPDSTVRQEDRAKEIQKRDVNDDDQAPAVHIAGDQRPEQDVGAADMRIDLTRIGGQR